MLTDSPTPVPPVDTEKTLDALLGDLKMPEGHKPVSKKVAASNYKFDKQYSTPGQIATQLRAYEQEIVSGPSQVRHYVTNKLIEISGCGDVKHEIKALELLGKIATVGLFSDNSQITVTHTTSSDLEEAIKNRIKALVNSNIIDIVPEEEAELETEEPEAQEEQENQEENQEDKQE